MRPHSYFAWQVVWTVGEHWRLAVAKASEPAPFFGVWTGTIQSQMKRMLDELFEHGGSPFTGNPRSMNCFRVDRVHV